MHVPFGILDLEDEGDSVSRRSLRSGTFGVEIIGDGLRFTAAYDVGRCKSREVPTRRPGTRIWHADLARGFGIERCTTSERRDIPDLLLIFLK